MDIAPDLHSEEMSFADPITGDTGMPGSARHAEVLSNGKLNTLGDLHALQQLCDRQARGVRGVFEPLLRRQPRIVADPIRVERFDDYLARLPKGLMSLHMLKMGSLNGQAMVVLEGGLVFAMLDLFFGGSGVVTGTHTEFTPSEDAIARRAVAGMVDVLDRTWADLTPISFEHLSTETNPKMIGHLDGDDPVVVVRFALTIGEGRTSPLDIVYPLLALKPLAPVLSSKVQGRRSDGDPRWQAGLTRAVMDVPLAVRSVLVEPIVPLSMLMNLKPGDVIPIDLGHEIPLLVASNRFACGTMGHANGRTAIRLDRLEELSEEDDK
jgi:flagellar motor switch protein FliM